MIEDVINCELDKNPEIVDLKNKLTNLDKEIDEFDSLSYRNYRSNVRLVIASFIACVVTVVLLFAFHTSLLPFVMSCLASRFSIKKLMAEWEEDVEKMMDMIDNYNLVNGELRDVVYSMCEKITKHFNVVANEAAILIKAGKFDEIIRNYSKYSDVVELLDENYSLVLAILITYGKEGVRSVAEIPERERNILYYMLNKLNDGDNPVMKLEIDSFTQESEQDISSEDDLNDRNPKTFVKKRPK